MVEVLVDFDKKMKWPPGHTYKNTCKCRSITGQTTLEYIGLQPPALLFREKYIPSQAKMKSDTVYRDSYSTFTHQPVVEQCQYEKRNGYLKVPVEPDIYQTIHQLSYTTPSEVEVAELCKKSEEVGMKHVTDYTTTNKQDFTFKTPPKREPKDMSKEYIRSSEPMECMSITRSSYRGWPVDEYGRKKSSVNYYQGKYIPLKSKMEEKSLSHSNFLKWEVPKSSSVPPWVEKERAYIPPLSPFNVNTVYNESFSAPGMYAIKERPQCKGCYCMRPGECFNEDYQIPVQKVCPSGYRPGVDPERPPPITEKKAAI